jgi:hypothetical protein
VAEVVEHLLSKLKAPSSNPTTAKKQKELNGKMRVDFLVLIYYLKLHQAEGYILIL